MPDSDAFIFNALRGTKLFFSLSLAAPPRTKETGSVEPRIINGICKPHLSLARSPHLAHREQSKLVSLKCCSCVPGATPCDLLLFVPLYPIPSSPSLFGKLGQSRNGFDHLRVVLCDFQMTPRNQECNRKASHSFPSPPPSSPPFPPNWPIP